MALRFAAHLAMSDGAELVVDQLDQVLERAFFASGLALE